MIDFLPTPHFIALTMVNFTTTLLLLALPSLSDTRAVPILFRPRNSGAVDLGGGRSEATRKKTRQRKSTEVAPLSLAHLQDQLCSSTAFLARDKPLLTVTALLLIKVVTSEQVRRAFYFWKHAGPIVAHYRWTQFLLTATGANRQERDAVYAKLHRRYAQPALDIAINLKGLYVKVGQVLSARPDFMPIEYTKLLTSLQDSIPPWPIEQVRNIVSTSLYRENGLGFSQVFENMQADALGSASIGQVHQGTLVDSWAGAYGGTKDVAVKVMHPDSKKRFQHDFQVFRWLCRIALPGWKGLLNELEKQLMTEFDYKNEALSLSQVRTNLASSKKFSKVIVIPEPHIALTTKHVLVMELLRGKRFVEAIHDQLASILGSRDKADALLAARKQEAVGHTVMHDVSILESTSIWTKFRLLRLQRIISKYVNLLVEFHGHQIFIDSVWNGDPHPGNCLLLSDGRMGLIDYGQTKRIEEDHERLALASIVVALGSSADDSVVADAMWRAGFRTQNSTDDSTMTKYARLFFDSDHEAQRLGFPTPQQYFASLMAVNPLTNIPDPAIFIARTSFLFRGMSAAIGRPMSTADMWRKYASQALEGYSDSSCGPLHGPYLSFNSTGK